MNEYWNGRLTRRGFLLALAGIGLAAAMPPRALASGDEGLSFDLTDGVTVGEYLRYFSPDVYASADAGLRELLDSSKMFSSAPMAREALTQSVGISAWPAAGGSIGYSFSFSCSASCSSLYALVTVTNLASGYSVKKEFWGSGTSLTGSGVTSGLPSGTYRAVVTAFAPEPPVGMTSAYSQNWSTVSV